MVGNRFLSLPCESLQSSGEIVIELQQDVIPVIALELTILLCGLAKRLRLQPISSPAISLEILADDFATKAVVTQAADGSVTFSLGLNQAEYFQAVLLRAYRDQVAEVNHIHIEGERVNLSFDLTILFRAFREPMSAEEAEKLLGD